jgi:hypothetical protein
MEKQRVIDSMQVEMTKVETQKETIIVNQPGNNTTTTTTTQQKRKVE